MVAAMSSEEQPEEGAEFLCAHGVPSMLVPFAKGDMVVVQSRTWPGINKPGGVGRVLSVNNDKKLANVKYALGGTEKNVSFEFMSLWNVNLSDKKGIADAIVEGEAKRSGRGKLKDQNYEIDKVHEPKKRRASRRGSEEGSKAKHSNDGSKTYFELELDKENRKNSTNAETGTENKKQNGSVKSCLEKSAKTAPAESKLDNSKATKKRKLEKVGSAPTRTSCPEPASQSEEEAVGHVKKDGNKESNIHKETAKSHETENETKIEPAIELKEATHETKIKLSETAASTRSANENPGIPDPKQQIESILQDWAKQFQQAPLATLSKKVNSKSSLKPGNKQTKTKGTAKKQGPPSTSHCPPKKQNGKGVHQERSNPDLNIPQGKAAKETQRYKKVVASAAAPKLTCASKSTKSLTKNQAFKLDSTEKAKDYERRWQETKPETQFVSLWQSARDFTNDVAGVSSNCDASLVSSRSCASEATLEVIRSTPGRKNERVKEPPSYQQEKAKSPTVGNSMHADPKGYAEEEIQAKGEDSKFFKPFVTHMMRIMNQNDESAELKAVLQSMKSDGHVCSSTEADAIVDALSSRNTAMIADGVLYRV